MKCFTCTAAILLMLMFLLPMPVCAVSPDDTLSSLTEGVLPPSDAENPVPDLPSVWQRFTDTLRSEAETPLRTGGLLFGVILLAALSGSLRQGEGTGKVYDSICTLCAVGTIAEPLISAFERAALTLGRVSDFMLAFTGIYGGVIAAGGNVTASAVWQGSMAVACDAALELSSKLLFPILSLCLAMSIVDAVNPDVSLTGLIDMGKKLTAWILGLLMAGFLGLLSVQTLVAAAADHAGTKAAKFVISGSVPIVGGAVSDAYTTVIGSMKVLRASVGVTGILMILALLLPVILSLGLYRVMVLGAGAVSELFGAETLVRLFRNAENVLAAALSAAVTFAVLFVFSSAVVMLIGTS